MSPNTPWSVSRCDWSKPTLGSWSDKCAAALVIWSVIRCFVLKADILLLEVCKGRLDHSCCQKLLCFWSVYKPLLCFTCHDGRYNNFDCSETLVIIDAIDTNCCLVFEAIYVRRCSCQLTRKCCFVFETHKRCKTKFPSASMFWIHFQSIMLFVQLQHQRSQADIRFVVVGVASTHVLSIVVYALIRNTSSADHNMPESTREVQVQGASNWVLSVPICC